MRRTRTRLSFPAALCALCSGPGACSRDAAVPEARGTRVLFLDGSERGLPPDRSMDLGIEPVLICQQGY